MNALTFIRGRILSAVALRVPPTMATSGRRKGREGILGPGYFRISDISAELISGSRRGVGDPAVASRRGMHQKAISPATNEGPATIALTSFSTRRIGSNITG